MARPNRAGTMLVVDCCLTCTWSTSWVFRVLYRNNLNDEIAKEMGKLKKLIGLDLYADNHRKNPQVTFQAQLTDIDVRSNIMVAHLVRPCHQSQALAVEVLHQPEVCVRADRSQALAVEVLSQPIHTCRRLLQSESVMIVI
ncbi:uncharacterized protein [Aegilops tauschii subsp. strangulata]|uniref:uncharacterized protein n=1 Tax=Aegilops tauschii subsp. strangulata TaxID=200361 RepID=UPI00098BC1DF|nr:uncharacterized protein LOC109775758 [Aegilops tauschii subsp. strangulata]XP_040250277.1 uncharacterized protein LOC109775758 [Aegilops tauschii subsp. strangulata]